MMQRSINLPLEILKMLHKIQNVWTQQSLGGMNAQNYYKAFILAFPQLHKVSFLMR